jgi:hypothetical protein
MKYPIFKAGYWISPYGRFFTVTSHIDSVIGCPASFGTSEEALRALYEHYHETYGCEGLSRVIVVKTLVKVGWIRARNYYGEWWSLHVKDFRTMSCARITHLFHELYPDAGSHEEAVLDTFTGRRKTTVSEIKGFALFPRGKPRNFGSYRLTFIEGPEHIPAEEVRPIKLVPLPDDEDSSEEDPHWGQP